MKKLSYLIGAFIIFYFTVIISTGVVQLARWISFGRPSIEYGFYALLAAIVLVFGVIPVFLYLSQPTLKQVRRMMQHKKVEGPIVKKLLQSARDEEKAAFMALDPSDGAGRLRWVQNCLYEDLKAFDSIIGHYARKTTISVMISPNAFIDGLIILLSNVNMLQALSKKIRVRVSLKDSMVLLFKVMSFSSVVGIYEEFDEVIEEALEEIIEEFTEMVSQDGPKEIIGSIPGLSILPKLISPLLQGAANFSFVYYIGYAFKNYLLAVLEGEGAINEEQIKRMSRREARKKKHQFLNESLTELTVQSTHRTGKVFSNWIQKLKKWNTEAELALDADIEPARPMAGERSSLFRWHKK